MHLLRPQRALADAKSTQKSADQEGKDKKKAERMAAMMAGLAAVRPTFPLAVRLDQGPLRSY